jgi:microsomal dipeptidase-like Zn-dependent dipeptidase
MTPIADLHCHYPMHLLVEDPEAQAQLPPRKRGRDGDLTLEYMVRLRGRPRRVDKLRAAVLMLAARLLNFRHFSGTWRVSLDRLEVGKVRIVLSVLYVPFAELDLDEWVDPAPDEDAFEQLTERLAQVESDLEARNEPDERAVVVRREADLDRAIDEGKVAMLHCVEGGFHLGPNLAKVDERVEQLSRAGVAYVTLAHLFWREVATNSPAIPGLPDWAYHAIFRQPQGEGLSELGKAAVRAMYKHDVLIDVSHMSERSLRDTFALLHELDDEPDLSADPAEHPVIATHAGFRFGRQGYMLSEETIRGIVRRGGVIGLIMARHQLHSGSFLPWYRSFPRTVRMLRRHIDAIAVIAVEEGREPYGNVAIGSDLDGFIKPTVGGIENVDDLARLEAPLREHYPDAADAILHGNAERVLRKALGRRPD